MFRLERVRQRQQYDSSANAAQIIKNPNKVSLFDDYAVLDRKKRCFQIGNLFRLVTAGKNGDLEYKRLVPYDDPKKQSITAYLQVYPLVKGRKGFY